MNRHPLVSALLPLMVWSMSGMALADATPPQTPAHGLDGPRVVLTHDQARSFSTALQALAAQGHVAFVAEDQPLHMVLTAKDVAGIPDTAMPLPLAVSALADAYDYDVQREGQVFQFTKRYTDPKDLPAVTLPECLQSLEDVRRITARFNPEVPAEQYGVLNPLVRDLVVSLIPDQMKAMHDHTLRVSALSEEQQAEVWRMAGYFYIQQPLETLPSVLPQLRDAARTDSVLKFRWEGSGAQRTFGYEAPRPEYDAPRPKADAPHFYLLCPAPAGRQEARTPPTPGATSLAAVLTKLNSRRAPDAALSVDAALGTKPVTVVGDSNVGPDDIWRGLAAVYGLRIVTRPKGGQNLTRFSVDAAASMAELSQAVRQAMPAPFLHALHTDTLDALDNEYAKQIYRSYQTVPQADPEAGQKTADEDKQARDSQMAESEAASRMINGVANQRNKLGRQIAYMFPGMLDTSVNRLRLSLMSRMDAAKDQKVPISQLDEADKRVFAVALTINFLQGVSSLLRQPPEYVSRFDQVYLTGGPETDAMGGRHLGVFLSLPLPDGRTFQQVGVGVPLYNFVPGSAH